MFDSEQRREAVDRLLAEHRELTARLSDPAVHQDPALARRLNRRFAELGAVVTAHRAWSAAAEELADARELAAAGDDDAAAFAAEVPGLEAAEAEAAERLRRLLIPRDPDDARDVILEIKGGEGGEEAALFAGDLLRMYLRWCESRGWKTELMEASGGEPDVIGRDAKTGPDLQCRRAGRGVSRSSLTRGRDGRTSPGRAHLVGTRTEENDRTFR